MMEGSWQSVAGSGQGVGRADGRKWAGLMGGSEQR